MGTAIDKEIEKKYLEAVGCYEDEINSNDRATPDSFINLSFLYWEFASQQIEFNIPNSIPDEWSSIGGERFSKVVDKGLEKYPNSLELNFWNRYFPYRLFQASFTQANCEELLRLYGEAESLVPYFFLYLFDKEKYKKQRDKLLELCNSMPTAKNLYIKSIIG